MKSPAQPFFVALCGGEGSGKSTVLQAIQIKHMPNIIVTREPGGSPYAEKIRELMFKDPLAKNAGGETMFGLFWAARADHIQYTINVALSQGTPVVSDRFDCCTYAYQIFGQASPELKELFWVTRKVYLKDRSPDLYIFLDIDPVVGLERLKGRPDAKNHFDEQHLAFHRNVRQGYLEFFAQLQLRGETSRFLIVDASKSKEEVSAAVLDAISKIRH